MVWILYFYFFYCFRYPPTQYRVLAFTGAPAAFPVQEHNRHLQGYLEFADNIVEEANNFIYYIRENYAGAQLSFFYP